MCCHSDKNASSVGEKQSGNRMNQCNVAENVDSEICHSSACLSKEYLEKDEPFVGKKGREALE